MSNTHSALALRTFTSEISIAIGHGYLLNTLENAATDRFSGEGKDDRKLACFDNCFALAPGARIEVRETAYKGFYSVYYFARRTGAATSHHGVTLSELQAAVVALTGIAA